MNLDHHINWMIKNYPTLYRDQDCKKSRTKVLNQLFLVIGNGYDWNEKGFLNCKGSLPELPSNFFEKELYYFRIPSSCVDEALKSISNRFHYITITNDIVFEALNSSDSLSFFAEINAKSQLRLERQVFNACSLHKFHPYPISDYSALVEILNGKTNSFKGNFEFTPQPDWLAGCVEIAEEAWNYYHDDSRYVDNSYYSDKVLVHLQWDLKFNKELYWMKNLQEKESVEQYAQRIWRTHQEEQIDILEQFLSKFK